jgi:predicted amidohydrolase YtcJ
MDPARPTAEALAVEGDRIAAVGTRHEVLAAAGDGAEMVELGGGALLPGFIDAHHHYAMSSFERPLPDTRHEPGTSVGELLAMIRELVPRAPGAWFRAHGYDPPALRERRPPRREELDELCPDRPLLLISRSFLEGCLNSRALEEMGWSERSADPPNGRLVRDRRGRLTGEIGEAALCLAEARSRGALLEGAEEAWLADCEQHGRELLAAGITRVGDAAVPPIFERLYARAVADDRLPLPVHRMPVAAGSIMEPRLDGEPTGSGPQASPAGPAKLLVDGAQRCALCFSAAQVLRAAAAIGARIASGRGAATLGAIRRAGPMRLGRDRHLHRGIAFWDGEALGRTLEAAAAAGHQVAHHAVGNEAVALAVSALDRHGSALGELPGRPRLEHLVFVDRALAGRMAAVGAMAVVQPRWAHDMGDDLADVPMPASIRKLPLRTLVDAGVEVALSSDYPAAHFDVLAAIGSAVSRRTRSGAILLEDEALTVQEALRGYTAAAAVALGVEREAGSIEAGKRADLVALSADPLSEGIDGTRVERTWVGGRLAFEATGTRSRAQRAP